MKLVFILLVIAIFIHEIEVGLLSIEFALIFAKRFPYQTDGPVLLWLWFMRSPSTTIFCASFTSISSWTRYHRTKRSSSSSCSSTIFSATIFSTSSWPSSNTTAKFWCPTTVHTEWTATIHSKCPATARSQPSNTTKSGTKRCCQYQKQFCCSANWPNWPSEWSIQEHSKTSPPSADNK